MEKIQELTDKLYREGVEKRECRGHALSGKSKGGSR